MKISKHKLTIGIDIIIIFLIMSLVFIFELPGRIDGILSPVIKDFDYTVEDGRLKIDFNTVRECEHLEFEWFIFDADTNGFIQLEIIPVNGPIENTLRFDGKELPEIGVGHTFLDWKIQASGEQVKNFSRVYAKHNCMQNRISFWKESWPVAIKTITRIH